VIFLQHSVKISIIIAILIIKHGLCDNFLALMNSVIRKLNY